MKYLNAQFSSSFSKFFKLLNLFTLLSLSIPFHKITNSTLPRYPTRWHKSASMIPFYPLK